MTSIFVTGDLILQADAEAPPISEEAIKLFQVALARSPGLRSRLSEMV